MLRSISIRQFAIIESLDLDLKDGLTVLTGETGAGKSILIGALNLVLGGRATPDLIRTGCDFAEVGAVFDLPDIEEIRQLLGEIGAESDSELIFRRQVVKEGRSKAWLNDKVVSVKTLGDLAEKLVDIAGQHQHQSLMSVENHLLLLDRFGKLENLRDKVGRKYSELLELNRERESLEKRAIKTSDREEFLRFQLNELEKTGVKVGEEEELIQERNLLANAETINEALSNVIKMLDENSAIASCSKAEFSLNKIVSKISQVGDLSSRIQSARIELEDISDTVRGLMNQAISDPQRLDELENRLAVLKRILQKHGPTETDVLNKIEDMTKELLEMESLDDLLDEMDSKIREKSLEALEIAGELSEKRKKAAKLLSKNIEQHLSDLGMKNSRFKVSVEKKSLAGESEIETDGKALGPMGIDHVEFLISPNQGEIMKPITRIASGGELSRVMLAIKSVLLEQDPVETSIFDEVDAGIGGEVAKDVGIKIKQLAAKRQVICITHLPQIVVYGDNHFKVKKTSRNGRTYSEVVNLNTRKEREEEVARMMTGEAKANASIKAARELIGIAEKTVQ